ncbi:MAG: carboxyltransferase domain-containing protein, partial [Gammaproteobacteria bacterium]|nr:carboxyltransferase domain-containing protein [Gammaproteobacteria bacterium]
PTGLTALPAELKPTIGKTWKLHVTYGPHGAPDYFTGEDIDTFFASDWEIHYNSSRTGVRLIGPKPEWARSDGGEAGMHPSNIHDNAYAVGTVDFTGDMPVILGPDGPSLGGFVCPVTVISADLWKLGQLKAGDKVKFVPVSQDQAVALREALDESVATLTAATAHIKPIKPTTPILDSLSVNEHETGVVYRAAGDNYVLVEYGPMELDIRLRFRAHALMLWLRDQDHDAILELTPGIRSLQVHYDSQKLCQRTLLDLLISAEKELEKQPEWDVPARIVQLPLSWDDEACQTAIAKYMQSVRKDAPWCPSNLEFIRRINGLDSIDEVKKTLFEASYLVMGLGDVYLGAPVATPLDPRHRLVTTKYNPARTWTAENSVGIGGAYLCIYGMEGPGGYQFVGRTLQMWNRYRTTDFFEPGKPWLLRF